MHPIVFTKHGKGIMQKTCDKIVDEIDKALADNNAFIDGYVVYSLDEVDSELDDLLFMAGLRDNNESTVSAVRIA